MERHNAAKPNNAWRRWIRSGQRNPPVIGITAYLHCVVCSRLLNFKPGTVAGNRPFRRFEIWARNGRVAAIVHHRQTLIRSPLTHINSKKQPGFGPGFFLFEQQRPL